MLGQSPWEKAFNSPEFLESEPALQRKIADDLFRTHFLEHESFQSATPEVQQGARKNFYDLLRQDDTLGDPWRRGLRNASHSILNAGRLLGLDKEVQEAQDWLETLPVEEATGKYTRSPESWTEYVTDPYRTYQTLAEGAPLMGALMGVTAASITNPALAPVALGALFGVEAGAVAEQLDDYETETGKEINPLLRGVAVIGVGAINAALERLGFGKILKTTGKGVVGRLTRAVISGNFEGFTEAIQEGVSIAGVSAVTGQVPSQKVFFRQLRDSYFAGLILGGTAAGLISIKSEGEAQAEGEKLAKQVTGEVKVEEKVEPEKEVWLESDTARFNELFERVTELTPEENVEFDALAAKMEELEAHVREGYGEPKTPLVPEKVPIEKRVEPEVAKTPFFKKWFGKSKVVNPDGSPRVVYHGTSIPFDRLDVEETARRVLFFSTDPKQASAFAGSQEGARVYPVYLKLENPFDFRNDEHVAKLLDHLRSKATGDIDLYMKAREGEIRSGKWQILEENLSALYSWGFDGFLAKENEVDTFGVFSSDQIRSAMAEQAPEIPGKINVKALAQERTAEITEFLQRQFPSKKTKISKIIADAIPMYENELTRKIIVDKAIAEETLSEEETAVVEINFLMEGREFNARVRDGAGKEEILAFFTEKVSTGMEAVRKVEGSKGRGLNYVKQYRNMGGAERVKLRLSKILSGQERKLRQDELDELHSLIKDDAMINDPQRVKEYIDRVSKGNSNLKDLFYSYFYANLLSGIPTHGVNILNNTGWSLMYLPQEKVLRGVIDATISKATGRTRQIYAQEIIPFYSGVVKGFKPGFQAFKEVMKTGRLPEDQKTKFLVDIGKTIAGAWGRYPNATVRSMAKFMEFPMNALFGVDLWFKSMIHDGTIFSLARRASLNAIADETLKPEDQKAFEEKFIQNPPDKAIAEAREAGQIGTFMDKPSKLTEGWNSLRNKAPYTRFVLTFINTLRNIFVRGVELTPGVAFLHPEFRAKPANEIIAKQLVGVAIGLSAIMKMANGEMTGAAPDDEADRKLFYQQGKKPFAMKLDLFGAIEPTWFSYRRVEPFGTVLGLIAVAYDNIANAEDDEAIDEIAKNLTNDISSFIVESSYISGVGRLFDKYGGSVEFLKNLLGSFIPASSFLRSGSKALEKAVTGEVAIREREGWLSTVLAIIPGGYTKLKPKIGIFGKTETIPGGVAQQLSPFKWSKEVKDPVVEELVRLDLPIGTPLATITFKGQEFELPPEIYQKFLRESGEMIREELEKYIARPFYERLSDDVKKKAIETLIRRIRSQKKLEALAEHLKPEE